MKIQIYSTITKLIKECKELAKCPTTMKQKINTVIRAGIAYSSFAILFSMPTIKKLDKKIIALYKNIFRLPKCTSNVITPLPHDLFGMEAFLLKSAYFRSIGKQLRNALNDTDRFGKIYNRLLQYVLAKYGSIQDIPCIKFHDCIRSPIT